MSTISIPYIGTLKGINKAKTGNSQSVMDQLRKKHALDRHCKKIKHLDLEWIVKFLLVRKINDAVVLEINFRQGQVVEHLSCLCRGGIIKNEIA